MLHALVLLPASDAFWSQAARAMLHHPAMANTNATDARDWSALCVLVPTMVHVQLLKAALANELSGTCILPRIMTMAAWLAQQVPDAERAPPAAASERLMGLYAGLRQHGWLKKLFSARRNTDLLPLAQTLLGLSDELTQSLLPQLQLAPQAVEQRWQAALEQLTPSARHVLSDEAQLVWTIWKGQLDGADACAARFAQMMQLGARAESALVWIAPVEPDPFEQVFLAAYGERQSVLPIQLDWRASAIHPLYAAAWPELGQAQDAPPVFAARQPSMPSGLALCQAASIESLAQQGAQIIVDWLAAGKSALAIVAQDRVVARRIRALLERAEVGVADETGWKLSTSRAAAALAAWFEVVLSRADTSALLDLLKSPYLFAEVPDKPSLVMHIEAALRRANVPGGWEAAVAALKSAPDAQALVAQLAAQAALFGQRKTLTEWIAVTADTLDALGMRGALAADAAGQQVIELLDALERECTSLDQAFSFSEWRALVSLQLESTEFVAPERDRRVVMLPLNGARLRVFDAVLVVGADAAHLPSPPGEALFFANAVRRELGLATREILQRQQLRDFAELLSVNREVVLAWQDHKDGEPNPVSPWIERLQLALARHGASALKIHKVQIAQRDLQTRVPGSPAPQAPQLLPTRLSASAYNKLVACPYQFFAERMLALSTPDELSDLPQKRDYGDWLHQILKKYHDAANVEKLNANQRAVLLADISESVFQPVLLQNPAALGFYVRWKKVIPAYLDWANEREGQGWQFAFGEREFSKTLQWPGGEMTLHGWVDRIDENDAGEFAVLDYKSTGHPALKKRLEECEDHQLAFYGLIADVPVASAHYVSLEPHNGKTRDVAAPRYADWQHQLSSQIVDNLRAISQGASLKASGIDAVCEYCNVRGLCRKGTW